MFKDAVSKYDKLLVWFGGVGDDKDVMYHGFGCVISPKHIVTADHNLTLVLEEMGYDWPVVHRSDGLYKCRAVYRSDDTDVAVLEIESRLKDGAEELTQDFPEIDRNQLAVGSTVGYLTWMKKPSKVGGAMNQYFSASCVAYTGRANNDGVRFMLASGFVEKGFSGSPVFAPDGSLVGILTGFVTMKQENDVPIYMATPYVSFFPTFPDDLEDSIRQSFDE